MISTHGCRFVALALLAGCTSAPTSLPSPVRFGAPIPQGRILSAFAVSPDGQWLAYSAETTTDRRRRIFIRPLRGSTEQDRELPGTIGGTGPFFSPDSTSLGFFSRAALWRVPVDGSTEPLKITDASSEPAGATWTEDGRIVFAPLENHGLVEVPAAGGGTPAALTALNQQEGELEHAWPHAIRRGSLVFTVSERGRDPHLEVLSSPNERRRLRVPIAGQSQFVEAGYLVYGYLGNLMAVKFDPVQMETRGVPERGRKGSADRPSGSERSAARDSRSHEPALWRGYGRVPRMRRASWCAWLVMGATTSCPRRPMCIRLLASHQTADAWRSW